jgi:flagellar motility protein MotE (MotC chaperone)
LVKVKSQTELSRIKKEISDLKKKLKALEDRKADLERSSKRYTG